MKNLYTFSSKSWHVRFYKWLFNTDPKKVFNTMCPYFWTYVLVILLLPIILLVKVLGKSGSNFLNKIEKKSREKRQVEKDKFIASVTGRTFTPEEAYILCTSKQWQKYSGFLSYDLYYEILDMQRDYPRPSESTPIADFKASPYYPRIQYTVLGIGAALLVKKMISLDYPPFDPVFFKIICFSILIVIAFVAALIGLESLIKKGKLDFLKYFLYPFIFIYRGIVMCADMVKNLYIKACPRITWED